MVPDNLFLVRHGQSEGNVTQGSESLSHLTVATPDNELRLTPKGVSQANAAGVWFKEYFAEHPNTSVHGYCSSFIRALETAGHLGLGLEWRPYPFIIERSWGEFESLSPEQQAKWKASKKRSPLYAPMPNGQSLSALLPTNHIFMQMLHREHSSDTVVAVCHGERILTLRYLLERMTDRRFAELMASRSLSERVRNAQILQYTSIDPESGEKFQSFQFMRSLCPWAIRPKDLRWRKIEKARLSDEELLAYVEGFPRFLKDTPETA